MWLSPTVLMLILQKMDAHCWGKRVKENRKKCGAYHRNFVLYQNKVIQYLSDDRDYRETNARHRCDCHDCRNLAPSLFRNGDALRPDLFEDHEGASVLSFTLSPPGQILLRPSVCPRGWYGARDVFGNR